VSDKPSVLFVCVHNVGRSQMAVRDSDVVITIGCGDTCPIFPGKRYEDWDLPDPTGQGVEAVRPIRDDLKNRIRHLIAELIESPRVV
jgi:arsenate reductase (thioredoxin)